MIGFIFCCIDNKNHNFIYFYKIETMSLQLFWIKGRTKIAKNLKKCFFIILLLLTMINYN